MIMTLLYLIKAPEIINISLQESCAVYYFFLRKKEKAPEGAITAIRDLERHYKSFRQSALNFQVQQHL